MQLWMVWFNCISQLRASCSRERTFLWLCVAVMGLSVRDDNLGVTSFVRSLLLKSSCYRSLLHLFHSNALKLDRLTSLWVQLVFRLFSPVMYNEYRVFAADGIKVPREGLKMPAVKSLHQESANNSKPAYIMGHSFQVVSLLVNGLSGQCFAVPLISRICEGVRFSNRDKRTLLDKLVHLFFQVACESGSPAVLVADAYYSSRKVILPLLDKGHHLVTRAKSNSTAYTPAATPKKRKPGRPKIYGDKVYLKDFFDQDIFVEAPSPVYGEKNVTIEYYCVNLMWRPVGRLVRFVLVKHPSRGNIILLSSLPDISALEVLRIYSLRFKIELSFRQAVSVLGSYFYHFWMKNMVPIKKGSGDQYMHRKSREYRIAVRRKLNAYHVWIQLACISQGLLMHLAVNHHKLVWGKFRSWLRTMKQDLAPSELVVSIALRNCLPEFLFSPNNNSAVSLFILNNSDPDRLPDFYLAA